LAPDERSCGFWVSGHRWLTTSRAAEDVEKLPSLGSSLHENSEIKDQRCSLDIFAFEPP